MADYRSRSYNDSGMQLEVYRGRTAALPPSGPFEYWSYNTRYAYSGYGSKGVKEKEAAPPSSSSDSSSRKGRWALSDSDFQRRKRVASYKAYGMEGRMKVSFRRSFRWLKDRYNRMFYEW